MSVRKLLGAVMLLVGAMVFRAGAQATFTDDFSTPVNYLTNGVAGTMWDGVYLGAGEIANATGVGAAAGTVSVANADISSNNVLTISSLQTDWENTNDDGAFLFKVIAGDFDMSVQVIGPIDTGTYNFPGLMVRAFGPGGAPSPGGQENSVLWGRFDEFSIANMLKNNVNGVKTDTGLGTYPNSNYWLRVQRVGDTLNLYQRAFGTTPWQQVGSVTRADFSGIPLQVGIEQSDYAGGATRTAQFANFSLSVSNLGPFPAPPAPATGLTLITNIGGDVVLSWTPGSGSAGSLVEMWTGNPAVKEAPADGFTYSGNAAYGQGDTLPTTNYYVVYSGPGSNVSVSNLLARTDYHIAVFSYSGSGYSTAYNHTPVTGSLSLPTGQLWVRAKLSGENVVITCANTEPGKWYQAQWTASLGLPDWQPVESATQWATNLMTTLVLPNAVAAPERFYRVEQLDSLPGGRNLAAAAMPETSYVSSWQAVSAINDGYVPTNSADQSHGAYGNWPETGVQWVEYDWPLPITTSMIDVYWWQDNQGIYAPAWCSLEYWDGTSFVPVSHPTGLGVALNQFNTTTFAPVTTTRLRLLFQSDAAGHSTGILQWRVYDAGGSPTSWPGPATGSQFAVKLAAGAIGSLQRVGDSFPTEYIAAGQRLGDANIKYRQSGGNGRWFAVQTASQSGVDAVTYSVSPEETNYAADYLITNGLTGPLILESAFAFQSNSILWSLNITNLSSQPVEIGDLALPLPMNTTFSGVTSSVFRHSFISGSDSFIFWMRPDSVGPYLLMTPEANTRLEYWDTFGPGSETFFTETLGGYEVYIHSYVAATNAAAQYPSVTTQGDRWRQPNTSLTLPAGGSTNYGFKFQWADGYKAIRQDLVDNGKIDIHVVPGMTVPTNLFAEFGLDTTQTIDSVTAEFPAQTQLQFLDSTNVNGNTYQIYRVRFSKLGENELTIDYGGDQTTYLQFFVTEPLETLIKKRAAFLVSHQIITNKWYSGLFCDWNMNDEQLITPDNHDTLSNSFQVYEIASDDAGESRPAYLATKEAVYPVQSEVSALDYYITNFVWGGLQRTTNESDSYGIYGTPDWYTLRSENNLSIGRGYDYPHIIVMYYEMYQVAKDYPEIHTALSAATYLQRAWGTAMAMWSYGGTQATQVGLMNEIVIPDVINALQAEGMTSEAASLRNLWETKVNYFVTGNPNLFGSEFPFDSTGFESQQAYARYAMKHLGSDPLMGSADPSGFLQQVEQYMNREITANVFDRGWLETTYYYYGSDYRALQGDSWVLSYMAQMGGWSLLDYALYYATNATDYLRLGYGSELSAWATMNSGPPPNYGFWYPGVANDGGCGGGFEPSPYNTTWLGGQPMHRGDWYYSAEENLGFCGYIRSAATILADDPIFGRFCYGGTWTNATNGIEIIPLDGVRRRFHAMLNNGYLHLVLENDRFAAGQPIVLQPDLSQVSFQIESDNPAAHSVTLHFTPSTTATYTVSDVQGVVTTTNLVAGQEAVLSLPMDAGTSPQSFTIAR